MEKIGFFGGTFDPIHLGHLNLIVELFEQCQIDRVLVCPANVSPTKQDKPALANPKHRLKMLELATHDLPYVTITEIELGCSGPSFTVKTLELLLKQEGAGKQFYLLMAEDSAYTMGQWKDPDKIVRYASPVVATRYGFDPQGLDRLSPLVKSKLEEGQVKISAMDISSTRVRERLKKKLYCGHLVPAKVLDYIYENRLY